LWSFSTDLLDFAVKTTLCFVLWLNSPKLHWYIFLDSYPFSAYRYDHLSLFSRPFFRTCSVLVASSAFACGLRLFGFIVGYHFNILHLILQENTLRPLKIVVKFFQAVSKI